MATYPVKINSGGGGDGTTVKIKEGYIDLPSSATNISVNCGFKPRALMLMGIRSSYFNVACYDVDIDSGNSYAGYKASSSVNGAKYALPSTNNGTLASIDSNGFTVKTAGSNGAWYTGGTLKYIAIG